MSCHAAQTLSASLEDYLETILQIVETRQAVRATDIGRRLKVSRSSVTGALHALAERKLIHYRPYDAITLTREGRRRASDVIRRHETLRGFFLRVLAIDPREADAAACKLEHAIPEGVLERFTQFVDFVERCPRSGNRWIRGFGEFLARGQRLGDCEQCLRTIPDDTRDNGTMTTRDSDQDAITLATLERDCKARILSIGGSGVIRRRLLEMGVTTGTVVEVIRLAPLGDPLEFRIKGYHLTIRKAEARRIKVQPQ